MGRFGKLAVALNESTPHAALRRAYKQRAHKAERRLTRTVLRDACVRRIVCCDLHSGRLG